MASRRSTTTSPKPLTDKPDDKQTSRKDKQTSREHVPDPSCSRIGIHITLYKPPTPEMCHSFHTSKMTGTHQEQLIDHLRVFLISFFSLIFIVHDIFKTQKTVEPSTCPANITITPTPTTQKEKEATESMDPALDTAERGCYRTLLDELVTTNIPGYRNFTRMEPAFFYLIEERITPTSGSQSPTSGSHWKSG